MRIVRNLRILTFLSAKIWSTGFSRPDYIREQLTKYTPASNARKIDGDGGGYDPPGIQRKHISALTRGEGDVLKKRKSPALRERGGF
jgi:hypothetical protein